MEDKICSFFGHSEIEITKELKDKVYSEIISAINYGCNTFYFGGYGEFDFLCLELTNEIIKEKKLDIKRVYCVSQERYLTKKCRYFDKKDYDSVIYLQPAFNGWYKSIYFRNLAMIDASSYVIFYVENRNNSGAYKTYQYAVKQKDKILINLA